MQTSGNKLISSRVDHLVIAQNKFEQQLNALSSANTHQ